MRLYVYTLRSISCTVSAFSEIFFVVAPKIKQPIKSIHSIRFDSIRFDSIHSFGTSSSSSSSSSFLCVTCKMDRCDREFLINRCKIDQYPAAFRVFAMNYASNLRTHTYVVFVSLLLSCLYYYCYYHKSIINLSILYGGC